MKKSNIAILLLICVSMILVTLESFSQESEEIENILLERQMEADNNDNSDSNDKKVIAGVATIRDYEEYETANGRKLILKRFTNNEEKEDFDFTISLEGKEMNFHIKIPKNKTWTYARLDGMVIIPSTPVEINKEETSYYPSGDELIVSFKSNNMTELKIYTARKNVPSLIISDYSMHWSYDSENRILTIKNRFGMPSKIKIYWAPEATLIEDTVEVEKLGYKMEKIENEFVSKNKPLISMKDEADELEDELDSIATNLTKLKADRSSFESQARDMDMKMEDTRDKITANVLLNPSHFAIWVIFMVILLILLLEIFLFKPKRVKK